MAQQAPERQKAVEPEVAITKKSGEAASVATRIASVLHYGWTAALTAGAAVIGFGGNRIIDRGMDYAERHSEEHITPEASARTRRVLTQFKWGSAGVTAAFGLILGVFGLAEGRVASDAKELRRVQDGEKSLDDTKVKSGGFSRFLTKFTAVGTGVASLLNGVGTVTNVLAGRPLGSVVRAGICVTTAIGTLEMWKAANRAQDLQNAKVAKDARVAATSAAATQQQAANSL